MEHSPRFQSFKARYNCTELYFLYLPFCQIPKFIVTLWCISNVRFEGISRSERAAYFERFKPLG